jgi:ribonuclease HI
MAFQEVFLYFDGASRNNPHGPAGCGWVVYVKLHNSATLKWGEKGTYLGYEISNNQAEYKGLIEGLAFIRGNPSLTGSYLTIFGDSEVAIGQMEYLYEVRSLNIQDYFNVAQSLIFELRSRFQHIGFRHIPRERNREADQLANDAIIKHFSASG